MKILIPTADYPPIVGGISAVALHVSHELSAQGHEVIVFAPSLSGAETFDLSERVKVIRYPGYWLGWFRFLPLFIKTLPYLNSSDLILGINVAYGGVIGLFAHWAFDVPYVTFAYAYEFLRFRRWNAARNLLLRVYEKSLVTIAISGFTRDRLTEFGAKPEKIVVIEPGAPSAREFTQEEIDAFKERFTLDECRVILGVGRFVERKGHVTLVNAMPKILERIPNALLTLVGTGPCVSAAINRAYALGVRENLLFPGVLSDDDVALMYRCCEVFALPTGDDGRGGVEGFGLVFTEANAYGKPVVAGRSGGVPDAVIDGETGILVEPNNPDATAEAILSLMESPERARLLGENGRRRVNAELSWSRFAERLLTAVETAKGRGK